LGNILKIVTVLRVAVLRMTVLPVVAPLLHSAATGMTSGLSGYAVGP
jgi:hypothetical protein